MDCRSDHGLYPALMLFAVKVKENSHTINMFTILLLDMHRDEE